MCSHNIHANSGQVDMNRHPKWSILGSTSLHNLRQEIKCYFFTLSSTTFRWFSFHSWINSLLSILPIHWKTLIWMNIVFIVHLGTWYYSLTSTRRALITSTHSPCNLWFMSIELTKLNMHSVSLSNNSNPLSSFEIRPDCACNLI